MRRPFLPHAWLLAGSLLAACATTAPAHVDDARLARLPPAEREGLIDQHRGVDIASSNLETAKVALNDAEQFRSIVESERSAAQSRLSAAQKSVALTSRAVNDANAQRSTQEEQTVASQRLDAANAKMQYAENLVALRQKQVDLRQAELDLAKADIELQRYDRLAAANQAAGLNRTDFVRAREDAQNRANQAKSAVQGSRMAVESSQRAWSELHHRFETASKSAGDTTTEAPPPPQPID